MVLSWTFKDSFIGGLNSKRNHIPSSQSQRRANDLTSNYSAISLNQRARAADPRSFRRNNHQSLDDQAGARFAQLSTELALSQARRTSPPSTALLLCSTYACMPSASASTNREQQVSGWVTAARHPLFLRAFASVSVELSLLVRSEVREVSQ